MNKALARLSILLGNCLNNLFGFVLFFSQIEQWRHQNKANKVFLATFWFIFKALKYFWQLTQEYEGGNHCVSELMHGKWHKLETCIMKITQHKRSWNPVLFYLRSALLWHLTHFSPVFYFIWDYLRDLVPSVQYKKLEKHPWTSITLLKITLFQCVFFTFSKLSK